MDTLTYTDSRQHLAKVMDKVCADRAPVLITRRRADNVVVMSQDDFDAMQETMYLVSNPHNAARLLKAIQMADAGEVTEHDLIEDE